MQAYKNKITFKSHAGKSTVTEYTVTINGDKKTFRMGSRFANISQLKKYLVDKYNFVISEIVDLGSVTRKAQSL